MQITDCARRKSGGCVFGHGFNSRRLHHNEAIPELCDSEEALVRDLSILSKYDFFFEENELIVRTIVP